MSAVASNSRRVALVTGGSRGIGLGIAVELAQSGFDLAINGRRDASELGDAIRAIQSQGASATYCKGDISLAIDRAAVIAEVRQRFGRLDLLVNNAGVAPSPRADLLEASEDSFDRLIATNLKGPYFLTQLAARWMIEQHHADKSFRGCVINISSISATVASVDRGDYCISKAGVAMATKLWAARLAGHGIDVFEVRPGIIDTDMTSGVKPKYDRLLAGDAMLEKRWGTPQDVSRAVAMLARGDLRYASGQVLTLDGGLTLQRL